MVTTEWYLRYLLSFPRLISNTSQHEEIITFNGETRVQPERWSWQFLWKFLSNFCVVWLAQAISHDQTGQSFSVEIIFREFCRGMRCILAELSYPAGKKEQLSIYLKLVSYLNMIFFYYLLQFAGECLIY